MLTARFGKKAIAVVGFALMTIVSGLLYLAEADQNLVDGRADGARRHRLRPDDSAAVVDVRRRGRLLGVEERPASVTGIIFATIGFALKAGLSLGSFLMLTLLASYGYEANAAQSAETLEGIRICSSVYPDDHVCGLHGAAGGLQDQQTADDSDCRRSGRTAGEVGNAMSRVNVFDRIYRIDRIDRSQDNSRFVLSCQSCRSVNTLRRIELNTANWRLRSWRAER